MIEDGIVKNLGVTGKISGGEYVGSIGAYIDNGNIQNIYSNVEIVGKTSYTGGIVGYISNTNVQNCINTNNVIGNHFVGGIVGTCDDKSDIKYCYNLGIIKGNQAIGGISGHSSGGLSSVSGQDVIEFCYNLGEVNKAKSGSNNSGGICGDLSTGKLSNVYNSGKIIGDYEVGAIAGQIGRRTSGLEGSIKSAYFLKGTSSKGVGSNPSNISNIETYELLESQMPKVIDVIQNQIEIDGETVNVWKEDTNNINNGYPILFWQ